MADLRHENLLSHGDKRGYTKRFNVTSTAIHGRNFGGSWCFLVVQAAPCLYQSMLIGFGSSVAFWRPNVRLPSSSITATETGQCI